MKWSNGRHIYHGMRNDRSKRKVSKITKGMIIDVDDIREAFLEMEYETGNQKSVLPELERHPITPRGRTVEGDVGYQGGSLG